MVDNLYACLQKALLACEPSKKVDLIRAIVTRYYEGKIDVSPKIADEDVMFAGRPKRPLLVSPSRVPRRNMSSVEGYAAMLHAICHIEFNAINLALDAAYRFRGLPEKFTQDWLQVAVEEAEHFSLMRERLQSIHYDYGDFEAHNHLWDIAYQTAFDPLLRMALVPRVLEARGLDVTPAIREKVFQHGDEETCQVLDKIYDDEVGHVRIGNYWYQYLCQQRGLNPIEVFKGLLKKHNMFLFRGYVNIEAREQAGFSAFELAMLQEFETSMVK